MNAFQYKLIYLKIPNEKKLKEHDNTHSVFCFREISVTYSSCIDIAMVTRGDV